MGLIMKNGIPYGGGGGGAQTEIPDWDQTDAAANDYIKNKPAIKDTGGYSKNTVMVNFLSGDFASTVDQSVSACVVEGYRHNVTHNTYATHVEGGDNIVYDGQTNHAEGSHNQLGDPDTGTHAFECHIEGSDNKILRGNQNHVEGIGNVVSGLESHAEGEMNTIAKNSENIHVEGSGNTTSGVYGHAEGRINTLSGAAAHVEGMNSTASGTASHAEGEYTVASGKDSHSGGLRAQATSNQTFAHGNTVTASNKFGTAFGISNYEKIAADDNDNTYTLFSIGNGTIKQVGDVWVKDAPSNAFEVRKDGTVVEGSNTATGPHSHAEGNGNTASGENSHAEGAGNTASGWDSHAEGAWCLASGTCSHAEGNATHAEGENAHSGGYASFASASNAFSHGTGTVASNANQASFGAYNSQVSSTTSPSSYTMFSIGNGADGDHRSNAFEVRSDGAAYAGGHAIITDTTIPAPPSANGDYVLKCHMADGIATYSWVVE